MTIKQLNKLNPQKYVISDGIFFIGSMDNSFRHTITEKQSAAVIWTYADTLSPHKLNMARAETKLSKLDFVQI